MRKSKEFLRRSRAARKGWRTRRDRARYAVIIRVGYAGRSDNSYSLTVAIFPYKRLRDSRIADLVQLLAHNGHFDDSENNPVGDLRWIAITRWRVIQRGAHLARGTAQLLDFEREEP